LAKPVNGKTAPSLILMKQPSASSQSAQQRLLSVCTGFVFALAIGGTLAALVALHPEARIEAFSNAIVISMFAGLGVFSRLDLMSWAGRFETLSSIVVRWLIVFTVVIVSGYMSMSVEQLSRKVMLGWLLVTPVILGLLAILIQIVALTVFTTGDRRRKAVFLRFHQASRLLARRMIYYRILGVDPVGYFDPVRVNSRHENAVPWLGDISKAVDYVQNNPVDIVFLGLQVANNPAVRELMEVLQDSTVSIYFIPDSRLFGVPGIQVTEMVGVPMLVVAETPFLGLSQALKRMTDIFISLVLLVALAPVLTGVAIAVKLSSPGPVLFRQKRYGVGGKEIDVYKFRSMKAEPPSDQVRQATQNDDRITRVGRFIRKTSLDELPQFFNVLQGSMSIVGPRPHASQHNELYRKLIPGYMLRHKVKPGITGWAQVNGLRGETETVEKMRRRIQYDLVYISHWSFAFDMKIILRTALLVFKDSSAY
jgi:putative colanic acid biosynthesis UDP-glucose lipid carrier transferase